MTNHQTIFFHKKANKTANEHAKQRNLLCFCFCFVFCCFFPGITSALMRTFTRQQYVLYLEKNEKKQKSETTANIKRTKCENTANKKEWKKATNTHSYIFCFFVCFTFCFFVRCFLLCLPFILAPCIYGWRARHNSNHLTVKWGSSRLHWIRLKENHSPLHAMHIYASDVQFVQIEFHHEPHGQGLKCLSLHFHCFHFTLPTTILNWTALSPNTALQIWVQQS